MTKNELRIKVAKLCGLKHFQPLYPLYAIRADDPRGEYGKTLPVPDYPNDLNACVEFEKTLDTEELQLRYTEALVQIPWTSAWSFFDAFKAVCATAEQRCRAFLKVKGAL